MTDLPAVSVVVLNLNGRSLLGDCLDSLAAQDYPRDRFEVIVVDNGSTDGSGPYVREAYPWVRLFEAGRNLGFAGGNDLGARMATGDYVAFINNDACADPHWLRAMVDVLETDPGIACAASKILGEDGKTIDFVDTGMNLYGRAFQIDAGLSAAPGFHDEPCEILAPCGGAMMIRRDVFRQVSGFDEDFVIYFEDVDLGWRLWILGYRVLFVPTAIVYHKLHKTGGRFPVEQRYTLTETNALRVLIKNCEEKNLWRVLPFSLFMGVRRSVEQAGLDRQSYQYGRLVPGDTQAGVFEPETKMTRVATSFLVAIDQIAEEMPRLLERRHSIQAARVRSDEEIFARFPLQTDNPIFPWRRYQVVQDQLIANLDIPDALKPRHGSRLLIITHETIGPNMAGPGIRAWEMACALSERFDVLLAAPGEPTRSQPGVRVVGYRTEDPYYPSLNPYIMNADVVLAMGPLFSRIPRLQDLGKPTIVDLYDPFELEKLAQSPTIEEQYHLHIDLESTSHLRLEGSAGDFFICASERQRDFWLGMLLGSGRVNTATYAQDPTLRALIDVVPFGMPSVPPRKTRAVLKGVHPGIAAEDKLLLWNGGLWQWFDPLTLVDALGQVVAHRDDVKLFFAAGKHFDPETVPEMPIYEQTVARCRELGLLDRHVFFGDWIPYDERGNYLLEADLGVSTHQPILESHFASRTRLVDCVWAGLPIVSTAGDPLSDMLAELGLARTVPPGRPDLLATAIREMLADEGLRGRVSEPAQRLRDALTWTRCVEPIANFLERAAFAPDALDATRRAAQARQVDQHIRDLDQRIRDLDQHIRDLDQHIRNLEKENQAMFQLREQQRQEMQDYIDKLEAHIEAINQGRVMRLLNALGQKREDVRSMVILSVKLRGRRQPRIWKHPETFVRLEDVGTSVAEYRPTFDFRHKFIDSTHKFFSECPRDGILIQVSNHRQDGSMIEGWLQREDALKLYELAYFVRGDILELGCHHGLSTCVLAEANRRSPYKKHIYAVDLNPECVLVTEENLRMKELSQSVTAICGDATEVIKRFAGEGRKFEYVFIDHSHAYEPVYTACRELRRIVLTGGFCLFHDFNNSRNRDAENKGFDVYQAVMDGLSPAAFEFYGIYGCSGLYRAI